MERIKQEINADNFGMVRFLMMTTLIRNGEIDDQQEIKDVVKTLVNDMGLKKNYVAGLIGKSERTVYRYLDDEKED